MLKENYTPKMLREILNTDNYEISTLCREAHLVPKKDMNGNTYFTKHDVNTLQKIKNSHSKNSDMTDSYMPVSRGNLPGAYIQNTKLEETFEKLDQRF